MPSEPESLSILDEWRGLLRRQVPLARQVLDRLLDGRIAWKPNREKGLYEFAGRVQFDRLLTGVVLTRSMVAVRGFATLRNPGLAVGLDFNGTVQLAA